MPEQRTGHHEDIQHIKIDGYKTYSTALLPPARGKNASLCREDIHCQYKAALFIFDFG